MGITGYCLGWIRAFLSNRRQYVCIEGICSSEIAVTSGVPQGSVLSPYLFGAFIDGLIRTVCYSTCKLFADDAKIYIRSDIPQNPALLQIDLNSVSNWTREWQLKLSIEKCSTLHIARNPMQTRYTIDNFELTTVQQAKDLGIYITSNLKPSLHCQKIAAEAFKISACILRNFSVKEREFLKQMFITFVRPKVEYATIIWSPWLKKDINLIERVQRTFTFKIPGIRGSYSERLRSLDLEPLQLRRIYADLVEVFKIYHGISALHFSDFFTLNNNHTRGHRLKLLKQKFKCEERKNFFSNRVVGIWNKLSEETIYSTSINAFKRSLREKNDSLKNFILNDFAQISSWFLDITDLDNYNHLFLNANANTNKY